MLVLVVDDNTDGRQLLSDIVDAIGHNCIQAMDGFEALELAAAHRPDLIILDVNMPGMSGFDVCARLKADPVLAHIPVLILTALADIDDRVRGLKLGADDYLTKPYNPRELMERIRARLRSKSETDELRHLQIQIRNTFERFVSPSVVEQLLQNPTQVKLGGVLTEVTVMFADLENFTTISEQTDPEKLLAILNRYHTMMVATVQRHGGTVDKFVGDAVMALYNTPLPQRDHALRAVMTALHIRDQLAAFHLEFEPQYRMNINFGIHTGMAVVGNVGAPDLMNFTAVGDAINLAARLQGLSKGGKILLGDATYAQLGEQVEVHPMGLLNIKGRRETVMAYEAIALTGGRSSDTYAAPAVAGN